LLCVKNEDFRLRRTVGGNPSFSEQRGLPHKAFFNALCNSPVFLQYQHNAHPARCDIFSLAETPKAR
jgi:hypothetical protein